MKKIICHLSVLIFTTSLFAGNLELIWERTIKAEIGMGHMTPYSYFEFDETHPGRLLLFVKLNDGIYAVENTNHYLTALDMNTGAFINGYSTLFHKKSMHPVAVDLYNDTVTFFLYKGYATALNFPASFELRILKAAITQNGFDFVPTSAGFPTFIEDKPKGYLALLPGSDYEINYDRNTGLLSKRIYWDYDGLFRYEKLHYEDSLYSDTLTISNLYEGLDIDTTGLELGSTRDYRVGTNNNILVGRIMFWSDGFARDCLGTLVAHFDDSGKIFYRKYIPETEKIIPESYVFGNGHIYVNAYPYNGTLPVYGEGRHFIRKITYDGEFISEHKFDYNNSPIFQKYSGGDVRGFYFTVNDKEEIYCNGVTQKDGWGNPAAFYTAKYDSVGNLLYEKEWRYKGGSSKIINNLIKDGHIYILGASTVPEPEDALYIYIAKFKEPETSIVENILTSSMLYPNPTSDQTTITLSLQQASQIRISLNDIFGRELQLIHDAFADACEFTKSFTTQGLPKGVYYLKIQIDGNTKIEKVVVN